jgi:hypothetical protein
MPTTWQQAVVASRETGDEALAKVLTCECGGVQFFVYLVGNHPHFQCAECDETFCEGGC